MPQILKLHGLPPNQRHIETAANAIRSGEVVLAPTETGYCFFADAAQDTAYERLYALRQSHPKQKPFSVLCAELKDAAQLALITTPIFRIAGKLLPGPYTLVLEAGKRCPQYRKGNKRKTVGMRVSSHPVAMALSKEFAAPLIVTSVTDAEELIADAYYEDVQTPDSWWVTPQKIALKFPRGLSVALEWTDFVPIRVSSVIDFTQEPAALLRAGGWENDSLFEQPD